MLTKLNEDPAILLEDAEGPFGASLVAGLEQLLALMWIRDLFRLLQGSAVAMIRDVRVSKG